MCLFLRQSGCVGERESESEREDERARARVPNRKGLDFRA